MAASTYRSLSPFQNIPDSQKEINLESGIYFGLRSRVFFFFGMIYIFSFESL